MHPKNKAMPQKSMTPSVPIDMNYNPYHHLATTSIAHAARGAGAGGYFRENHEIGTTAQNLGSFTDPSATMRPSPKGMVIETTLNVAVETPTESGDLLCPEFSDADQCRVHGRGLGAVVRKAIDVATFTVSTPSPPDAYETVSSGFSVQPGTKAMKPTTTGATAKTTHDHHQTDLFFQASNHLSQALYQLRHATGDQGIKTAAGRANAAARALNRLVTAYSEKRKEVELVPVTDPRLAQHYPETSGGLSAEPDGPWLLAIGRKCTDQQLEQFAKREGFSVAELVAFRDGLVESGVMA